jgi:hypothetical protein
MGAPAVKMSKKAQEDAYAAKVRKHTLPLALCKTHYRLRCVKTHSFMLHTKHTPDLTRSQRIPSFVQPFIRAFCPIPTPYPPYPSARPLPLRAPPSPPRRPLPLRASPSLLHSYSSFLRIAHPLSCGSTPTTRTLPPHALYTHYTLTIHSLYTHYTLAIHSLHAA